MASKELEKLMSQLKMNAPVKSMPVLTRAKSVNSNDPKKIGKPAVGPNGEAYDDEMGDFDENGNYHEYTHAERVRPDTFPRPRPAQSANHVRGQRNNRKDKVFNPEFQYTPDNTSILYDFKGLIPQYNPFNLQKRPDGSYDYENTSRDVLATILRRMISMYLTEKRRSTATIKSNKRLIRALLETKKLDDYEFRRMEEEQGYTRIYKRE